MGNQANKTHEVAALQDGATESFASEDTAAQEAMQTQCFAPESPTARANSAAPLKSASRGEAKKIAIIGAGSWGTALAALVAPKVENLALWCHEDAIAEEISRTRKNPRYLNELTLPQNLVATSSCAEALAHADAVFLVVPSLWFRATAEAIAPFLAPDTPVLIFTKGMEAKTDYLMHEVAADVLAYPERIAVLSGPNHAEEVAKGMPSAAVIAAQNEELALWLKGLISQKNFRIYVSSDLVGVELCAAIKNVIALACGAAKGLGFGDNTLAVLMTRGLAEISRIVCASGGDPLTCMGLAGMGDLVVTCTSRFSRNRSFGEAFVAGESLEDYQRERHMVVEGAEAAKSICAFCLKHAIEAPLTCAVAHMLDGSITSSEALEMLLARESHREFYGLTRAKSALFDLSKEHSR